MFQTQIVYVSYSIEDGGSSNAQGHDIKLLIIISCPPSLNTVLSMLIS